MLLVILHYPGERGRYYLVMIMVILIGDLMMLVWTLLERFQVTYHFGCFCPHPFFSPFARFTGFREMGVLWNGSASC